MTIGYSLHKINNVLNRFLGAPCISSITYTLKIKMTHTQIELFLYNKSNTITSLQQRELIKVLHNTNLTE